MIIHYLETRYGFEYGSANIERLMSDQKTGKVYLGVTTPKGSWSIYITKTGKVRVFAPNGKELIETP